MAARSGPTRPRALSPGAVIGICAPAGPMRRPEALDAGLAWLEEQGWRGRCAPHLRECSGYLAGSDETRLADLLELVRDPEVAAIMPVRGGYGITRILRRIDLAELVASRKLFVGYSDATALALWLAREGVPSIHGPMFDRDDVTPAARERLAALLRGEASGLASLHGRSLAGGHARGRLVGGNLRMLCTSLGTPWEIDTRGAILFVEETGEQPYAIDRSLGQLRDAGKLSSLVGAAVGQLVDCESERYPDVSACDVIRDVLVPEVDGPVVGGLAFGHVADNRALGVGVPAELDGDGATLTQLEQVVEDAG